MTPRLRQTLIHALHCGIRCAGAVAVAVCAGVWGTGAVWAQAVSLDQIYRDSLREENAGALPGYVLNRGLPPYPEPKPPVPGSGEGRLGAGVIDLPLHTQMAWNEVLKNIAGGQPSPFAVDAVRRRAERNDPQAIELLAWMFTNGVGVKRDLPQAFDLYVKADALGIANAKENAKAVLKSMRPEERRTVMNPFG